MPEILAMWREDRVSAGGEDALLLEGMKRLTVSFVEFLRSPETIETFNQGGATRALVGEIARLQHQAGRDAVGVIEDFTALRRFIWRAVGGRLDLSSLNGGEVSEFFVKLMQAADWLTETGLKAFDEIVRSEMDLELGRAAATDLLTGLPDRDLFSRVLLPRALEAGERLSIVVFDVAGFSEKVAAGEVALARDIMRRLSDAIQQAAPEDATCARFGDDEVCALLPGVGHEEAYRLVERVLDDLTGYEHSFEVDAGVAEFPLHASDASELINEMLGALKMAKRVGGGGIVVAH